MSFQQKKKLCALLIILLFLLVLLPALFLKRKQPQGEYITTGEVSVLTELLQEVHRSYEEEHKEGQKKELNAALETAKELSMSWTEGSLTYKQFREWSEPLKAALHIGDDVDYDYEKNFSFLKKDWYAFFDVLCVKIDSDQLIQKEELLILGDSDSVKDIDGNPIGESQLFSGDGLWENKLPFRHQLLQKQGTYITYNHTLWGVTELRQTGELQNVWLIESKEEGAVYFYGNHEVTSLPTGRSFSGREQVADLYFNRGQLEEIKEKKERISGEVLKLTDTEIEIKGQGIFELADSVQYYRLYDSLETVGRNSIRIGYSFSDFVMEDGKIQAGLLVKDEQMENIRVLLKTTDFNGYYHKVVECRADVDMELHYGQESLLIPAGESLKLDSSSPYFEYGRIYLRPTALTGRTSFSSIGRNNQGQGYLGSFEMERREEGILIVNEVLLEEYLYAVVPSEMPGYYPMEALKAQAVCARTYAYDKMLNSSLGSWGAHLDDSSTFQVYNNIQENTNTTKAVKETRGLLLYGGEGLASTYYYSTSCGFGTDDAIWNREGIGQIAYLQAKEMTEQGADFTAEELMEEETFRNYINSSFSHHFEAQEPWYRWTYEHRKVEQIVENLLDRREKYPNDVLVRYDEGASFEVGAVPGKLTLMDIQVRRRGKGGTVEELLFICKEAQILVKRELNVRAVLTDGESSAVLQDGKTYACRNLLPSAFYYITVEADEEGLSALKLFGGGFGHGVGMSQNGAKNLANQGRTYEDILTFYYADCQIHQP